MLTQAPQVHGYFERIAAAHGVEEKRQAAAAVGAFAKRAVDLAGRDHRVDIGSAHPVHRGADLVIGNALAVTDDH